MDTPRSPPPLFDLDDVVAGMTAEAGWLEMIRAVSEAAPDQAPEVWLGQMVMDVQAATDRAVAAARARADALVAAARTEARAIREQGRERAAAIGRPQERQHPPAEAVPTLRLDPDVSPLPAPPEAIPARPTPILREKAPSDPTAAGKSPPAQERTVGGPHRVEPRDDSVPLVGAAGRTAPSSATGARGGMRRPAMLTAVAVVTVAAVVTLGLVVFERYDSAARERGSQHHLAAELARSEAPGHAPVRPADGAALGFLELPRLAIARTAVVEGATPGHLRRGPAHDSTSPMPGQRGAVVIVGHRRSYGGPLGRIGRLRIGDAISLRTPSGRYVYHVSRKPQVLPSGNTSTLPSTSESAAGGSRAGQFDHVLILATSAPSGGGSLEMVVATLDQASPASGSASPSPSDAVARVRSVPGQPIGMVLALVWLVIVGAAIKLVWRLRPGLPGALLLVTGSVVATEAVFQTILALDRLLPGTY